jgi:hypothetical protein
MVSVKEYINNLMISDTLGYFVRLHSSKRTAVIEKIDPYKQDRRNNKIENSI